MWFLAEGRVHHIHLTVPRTLYLDSEVPLEEGTNLLTQGQSIKEQILSEEVTWSGTRSVWLRP
jgi:hypothetical protein